MIKFLKKIEIDKIFTPTSLLVEVRSKMKDGSRKLHNYINTDYSTLIYHQMVLNLKDWAFK